MQQRKTLEGKNLMRQSYICFCKYESHQCITQPEIKYIKLNNHILLSVVNPGQPMQFDKWYMQIDIIVASWSADKLSI